MLADVPDQPWTRRAEGYERAIVASILEPWSKELLRHVPPRPGERVLDVACGTGVVARAVAPLVGQAGHVTGLDLSEPFVAWAATVPVEGATIEWIAGDAQALPFDDGQFDLVYCQQGLQFMPDRQRAVAEMRRVLRPDGRVGIAAFGALERHPVHATFAAVLGRWVGAQSQAEFESIFALSDRRELERLLVTASFRDVTVTEVERVCLIDASAVVSFWSLGKSPDPAIRRAVYDEALAELQPMMADGRLRYSMTSLIGSAIA
jgi:ubiquinone/menaquinone biosynthesis C-methylase UbiE